MVGLLWIGLNYFGFVGLCHFLFFSFLFSIVDGVKLFSL